MFRQVCWPSSVLFWPTIQCNATCTNVRSQGRDGCIKLWDLQTNKPVSQIATGAYGFCRAILPGSPNSATRVCVHPPSLFAFVLIRHHCLRVQHRARQRCTHAVRRRGKFSVVTQLRPRSSSGSQSSCHLQGVGGGNHPSVPRR